MANIQTLTEKQIEDRVERIIDCLDRQLLTGKLSQQEYDHEVMIVDKWAMQQISHYRSEMLGNF